MLETESSSNSYSNKRSRFILSCGVGHNRNMSRNRGSFYFAPCEHVHAVVPSEGYILYQEDGYHWVVYDAHQKQIVQKFKLHNDYMPKMIAWLPDIRTFMVSLHGGTVYKLVMGKRKAKRLTTSVGAIISSDGEHILSFPDKKVWSSRTQTLLYTLEGPPEYFNSFEIRGDRMYTLENCIKVWEIPEGKLVNTYDLRYPGHSMIMSNDGVLAVRGIADITLIRSSSGMVVTRLPPAYRMHFSPNGKYLATMDIHHTISIWDVYNGVLIHERKATESIYGNIAITDHGLYVFGDNYVIITEYWDIRQSMFSLYWASPLRFFDGDFVIMRRLLSLFTHTET